MSPAPHIAILNYQDALASAVHGLTEMFLIASEISREEGGPPLTSQLLNNGGGPGGIFSSIIIPPNTSGNRGANTAHDILVNHHARGGQICAVCAGVFWLGHAGLLTGRPVTTHWALCEEFRKTFPDARLLPEHILIDDHDIITAGGMMAWVDLGLFLVEQHLGADVMLKTARFLLVDPRGRSQLQYRGFTPNLHHGDAAIRDVQDWMERHAECSLTVSALAKRAGMAERTFIRRFQRATGLSPNAYVRELRIQKAKGLLERTRDPVQHIAWAVGYKDVPAFTRAFRRITGLSPGEFRRRFSIIH